MRKRLKKKKGMLSSAARIKEIASNHAHEEAQVKRVILFYAEAVIDPDPDCLDIRTIADTNRTAVLGQYKAWRRRYGDKRVRFETEAV